MNRGKNQAHFRYFPNSVYLHNGIYVKVAEWSSSPVSGIDYEELLEEIEFNSEFFLDHAAIPNGPGELEIRELEEVRSSIFPLTFRCANCWRVVQADDAVELRKKFRQMEKKCEENGHHFHPIQFRFVSIDTCGFIGEGYDPERDSCDVHGTDHMYLNTHNSDRVSNFRWECRKDGCDTENRVRGVRHGCWSRVIRRKKMSEGEDVGKTRINLVKKNVVSIPEVFSRVNLKDPRRIDIKQLPKWKHKVYKAATGGIDLVTPDLYSDVRNIETSSSRILEEIEGLKKTDPEGAEEYMKVYKKLHPEESFVDEEEEVPDRKAKELLDYLLALNQPPTGMSRSLVEEKENMFARISELGLKDLVLLEKINLTRVLYGYSRGEYEISERRLCFFNQYEKDSNKISVYCSPVDTEGMMIVFDPEKIYDYLKRNNAENLANYGDPENSLECHRALVNSYSFGEKEDIFGFSDETTSSALIYSVLHSFSHLFIRALGKYSGMEENSLAEIIFPTACAVLIYVNQSGNFNLGTFSTCFSNHMAKILDSVEEEANDCLYDPICTLDSKGACPACIQLGEVSCENFNRNLSRLYLIGGEDVEGLWE